MNHRERKVNRIGMHLLVGALLAIGLGACSTRLDPLLQPSPQVLGSANGSDTVREAIVTGATRGGWQVIGDEPGRLTLRLDVRGKHSAIVAAEYDESGYRLGYVSSSNLLYEERNGKQLIHRNYNRWISNLIMSINREAAVSQAT